MSKECRTCRYCNFIPTVPRIPDWAKGECRRRAPTIGTPDYPEYHAGKFPVMLATGWCGEWEEKV